jgi:hypothetical protein
VPYFEGVLDAVCEVTRADALKGADVLAASLAVTAADRMVEAARVGREIDKRRNLLDELLERYESSTEPAQMTAHALRRPRHRDAPVAIGVSGGKDSSAVAIATVAHLDKIGHTGPRVLVHADLGVDGVGRLAAHLRAAGGAAGPGTVVVRRKQGDMMDRWEQRWRTTWPAGSRCRA